MYESSRAYGRILPFATALQLVIKAEDYNSTLFYLNSVVSTVACFKSSLTLLQMDACFSI